jgi:hypothetical protein
MAVVGRKILPLITLMTLIFDHVGSETRKNNHCRGSTVFL